MTRPRLDSHSTEFGLWLREQKEIDSRIGYVTTNIDYLWRNYKTGEWMLIEEKRYLSAPKFPQTILFDLIDKCAKTDPMYRGFHVVRFENASPDDGAIFIDGKESTRDELINFLRFQNKEAPNGR